MDIGKDGYTEGQKAENYVPPHSSKRLGTKILFAIKCKSTFRNFCLCMTRP